MRIGVDPIFVDDQDKAEATPTPACRPGCRGMVASRPARASTWRTRLIQPIP